MKVLVADDDGMSRAILAKLLAAKGHEVVQASDGKGALEKLAEGGVSMVFLDWVMPGMDGIEACREIRQLEERSKGYCYVIMVTAKAEKEDFLEAAAAGVDEFITKPIDERTLWARVRTGERILGANRKLAQKNEELLVLRNQLIMHNVELRGQISSLKERVSAQPAPEKAHDKPYDSPLEKGEIYLVECRDDTGDAAYALLKGEVTHGIAGLVLSRAHPAKVKARHDLVKTKVIWLGKGLARDMGELHLPMNLMPVGREGSGGMDENLAAILELSRDFIESKPSTVILLDGIEYLFTRFRQHDVMELLYSLSEIVRGTGGRILVACYPGTIDEKTQLLLKREMAWMPEK